MISARKLSELLASLYSAPLEQANWQVFLAGLCEATSAAQGACIAIDVKRGLPQILAQGGMEFNPEIENPYNQHYSQLDPYSRPFALKARIGVIPGEELVSREELEKTEFYNDFLIRNGLHHAAMMPATVTPRRLELVSIWRGARHGELDTESIEFFELLLPHLQSALQVRHVLSALEARTAQAEAALDTAPTASFILSGSGRVAHMNEAAESLVRSQDGVGVSKSRLTAADPAAQTKLHDLIASAAIAAGAGLSTPGGAVALPRPSGKRPLHAMVLPLRLPMEASTPVRVLVLITDAEAAVNFPAAVLSALFGLTRSEVEIANALLAGLSLEEIAELRHVTAGTLRVQMKTIFYKTGTNRQRELMRLLMSLPQTAPAGK